MRRLDRGSLWEVLVAQARREQGRSFDPRATAAATGRLLQAEADDRGGQHCHLVSPLLLIPRPSGLMS